MFLARQPSGPPLMRTAVRVVAAIQIAGAAFAGVLAAGLPVNWLGRALPELLAAAGVLGGVLLWRGDPRGFRVSGLVWASQLVKLTTAALTYYVGTGPQLVLAVQDGQLALTTGLGAGAYIASEPVAHTYVGLNVAAVACLVVLWAARAGSPPPAAGRAVAA